MKIDEQITRARKFYSILQSEHDMEMKLTSKNFLNEVQKALEAHGCKSWVANLSLFPIH